MYEPKASIYSSLCELYRPSSAFRLRIAVLLNCTLVTTFCLTFDTNTSPAQADALANCPSQAEIVVDDGEAVLPEFPRIVRLGEREFLYTVYNETKDNKRLDTFSLRLGVDTPVVLSGLGLIVDGKPITPDQSAANLTYQSLEIPYVLAPKLKKDRVTDVRRISVIPIPRNARSTVAGLQNIWSELCGLEKAQHSLHRVFDNRPEDKFEQCGGRSNTNSRSYVSADNFQSDTVIECLGQGYYDYCQLHLEMRTWNLSVSFERKKLPRWKGIRSDLLAFVAARTCEKEH